jgi:hypothetical protein
VIVAAAFCPPPPLLVPVVAGGAAAELDALRAACRTALETVNAPGRRLVLLGAGPHSQAHSPLARGSLRGFGVDLEVHLGSPSCGGAVELPPSLTVGGWLVNDVLGPRSGALAFSVGPDFAGSRAAVGLLELAEREEVALLVRADGSARRSETPPGYLHPRAAEFDETVRAALAGGQPAALTALDAQLGTEVLAAGVPAWHAAASVLAATRYDARLLYADAPYGVGYFVAAWTAPTAPTDPAAAGG